MCALLRYLLSSCSVNWSLLNSLQETSKWLDTWESYIRTLSEPRQKLFLSRQTCQGLRVSLKSTFDLTTVLLSAGFAYVLTGKFCQDPLEVNLIYFQTVCFINLLSNYHSIICMPWETLGIIEHV